MQPGMVYEILYVAMVIEYNIGGEFQKTSMVQRETELCACACMCVYVCVCVYLCVMLIM